MGQRAKTTRRRIPLRRRLTFIALAIVLLVLLGEVVSLVAYSVLQGELFSYTGVAEEQRAIAGTVVEEAESSVHSGFSNVRIDPYLGYSHTSRFLDQLARPRDPREFRILILGGSVAGNLFAKGRQHLIAALQDDPTIKGRRIAVLQQALGGYKQPQQLLTLTYLLAAGGAFDAVVNLDGFNDIVLPISDNLPKGVHPYFPRGWWQLSDVRDPQLRQRVAELSWLRSKRRQWAAGLLDSSVGYSVSMQLLWKVRDHRLAVEISDRTIDLNEFAEQRAAGERAALERLGFGGVDETRARLAEQWTRCSIEMQRLCAEHGIRYIHYLQPNQYAGKKPMDAAEQAIAIEDDHMYAAPAREGYPYLRGQAEVLQAAGVRFRDLTDLYAEEPRPVYTDACCHLNELGCRLIAELAARDIVAQ